jgi:hypothetical protein
VIRLPRGQSLTAARALEAADQRSRRQPVGLKTEEPSLALDVAQAAWLISQR